MINMMDIRINSKAISNIHVLLSNPISLTLLQDSPMMILARELCTLSTTTATKALRDSRLTGQVRL